MIGSYAKNQFPPTIGHDHQFPLKARQQDDDVGKVDLFAVADDGRLMVIELKVRRGKDRGDNPVFALMEGLRYAAIVDANRDTVAKEAEKRFDVKVGGEPPIVQILAPVFWWRGWTEIDGSTRKKAGFWEREFSRLIDDINADDRIGVLVECVALDDLTPADIDYGEDENAPRFDHPPALYAVRLGKSPAIAAVTR